MIPAEITQKIARLLPLLGSDQDGEVLAAVRAIRRTLAAAGSDLHALAASLPQERVGFTLCPAGLEDDEDEAGREQARDAPDAPARTWGMKLWGDRIEYWSTVARHALTLDWTYSKAEGGRFLTKQERERLKVWTRNARLTNADADWLQGVVERLQAVARKARHPGRNAA